MTDTGNPAGSASSGGRHMLHPEPAELSLPAVLFALSDPARLDLIRVLAANGPQTVAQCHLLEPDVPKSTFSHHLRTLRQAGVIRNEPDGRQRRITLRRADLEARFPGFLDAVLAQEGQAPAGATPRRAGAEAATRPDTGTTATGTKRS